MKQDYICECDLDFTGRLCETMIDACESINCSGHGECIDKVHSFLCNCDQGYEGLLCERVASSGKYYKCTCMSNGGVEFL